jgi:Ca2+-binding RTX toxin-like protein
MRVRIAVAALACAAALPAAAQASTAQLDGDVLRVTGTPGVDQLTIFADGDQLIVRDGFSATSAGPGCTVTVLQWATCPLAAIARVEVDLGDGDDVAILRSPRPLVAHGGAGDDSLLSGGGAVAMTLDGGPGDDHLAGGPEADVLLGGPGDDGLDGGGGADTIDPGTGHDAIAGRRDPFTPDCTPEIAPPTAAATRALRSGRALHLDLTVADGCTARTTLLVAGVAYAHASASAASSGGVTLRPSRAGLRALRKHRGAAVVRVVVRGAGGAVVSRRLALPG